MFVRLRTICGTKGVSRFIPFNFQLQVFDFNKDGRLQLSEMAKLLPVKENFLCRQVFKGATKLTRADIERVFALYDRACLSHTKTFSKLSAPN
ncbi:hypothetical protein JTB14_018321 [Gonioctena quinquepunctata]|nr:hypothetical protein JTB14_018321 [Gonioctena quinquepunctata]